MIHLAVKNGRTGNVGNCYTPTEHISTACRVAWTERERPRRSLLIELVTCPECRSGKEGD